jgi:hypothetical protein
MKRYNTHLELFFKFLVYRETSITKDNIYFSSTFQLVTDQVFQEFDPKWALRETPIVHQQSHHQYCSIGDSSNPVYALLVMVLK